MSGRKDRESGAVVFRLGLIAAGVFGLSTNAAALWQDKMEVFVAETVTHEDNVFRLSDSANTVAALGTSEKSDTITATSAGVNFDIPWSRQRFRATTRWSQVRYDHFSDLDHTSRDARLVWLWQLGNDLNGELGYVETKALSSFTNFESGAPRRVADPVKTQSGYGTASHMLTPRWRLQAGAAGLRQRHENGLRDANDIDLANGDVTVSYVSRAGNSIGLSGRREEAEYPNQQTIVVGGTPTLFQNDYSQGSLGLVGDWTLTGKSRVTARLDRVNREYDQLGQRDFDGTTGRANYEWKTTGKLTLNAEARRDISTTEDIQTSFVLVKGIALRPVFRFSEKLRFTAIADFSIREYLGDPGLVVGGGGAARRDHARKFLGTVSYAPMRSLTLDASWQHENRSSNQPFIDYDANIFSLTARLAF